MERRHRSVGLKVVVFVIVLLLALAGAALALYMNGFGFPSQETVTQDLFKNPTSASVYVDGTSKEKMQEVATIIPDGTSINIDGVNKSMDSSVVYVTGKTPQGGEITYEVSMLRDMIGWKVLDVKWYHPSVESA